MLQRLRESLALLLILLLPFHAFLVTVLTRVIAGPGHPPLGMLAAWKELLLGIILLLAAIEWMRSGFRSRARVIDRIDLLILFFVLLAALVSAMHLSLASPTGVAERIVSAGFGFKYNLLPLIAFFVLRRVPWSESFQWRATHGILIASLLVIAYGFAALFLPQSFFSWLGYSDLHSLYLAGAPLAPFQQIGGSALRRMQSVLSGPNQLGMWLLIPLGMAISAKRRAKSAEQDERSGEHRAQSPEYGRQSLRCRVENENKNSKKFPFLLFALCCALFATLSRAAWIAAAAMLIVAFWPRLRSVPRTILLPSFIGIIASCIVLSFLFPSVILRLQSSRDHLDNPIRAIRTMIDHPLGLGLGSAGPASNRVSETCVLLDAGADVGWAQERQDLCVFVDRTQVQPLDHMCNCPFLPENWYLQIGVELGWIGFLLYLALIIHLIIRSIRSPSAIGLVFIGVSISALFLHAWEDSAVAYSVWILLAAWESRSRVTHTASPLVKLPLSIVGWLFFAVCSEALPRLHDRSLLFAQSLSPPEGTVSL